MSMIKTFIEIGGWLAFAKGKKVMQRKAFQTLVSRGVLPATTSFQARGTQALLKVLGGKNLNASELSRRLYNVGGRNITSPGASRLARQLSRSPHALDQVRGQATRAYTDAARQLAGARTLGAGEAVLLGVPMLSAGFSIFSGIDSLAEKNIAPPAQEMAQTQQFFMPRQAYTQRQRAIQSIHQSQLTTRNALGNEANYLHS